MSDEPEVDPTETGPVAAPITLTITHDPTTGRIDLSGPIRNRLLCYGLLETAREILLRQGLSDQMNEKKVVVPPGFRGFRGFPGFGRGRPRG